MDVRRISRGRIVREPPQDRGASHPHLEALWFADARSAVVHHCYSGGRDVQSSSGIDTRAGSPAVTGPLVLTTPITPHLNGGPAAAESRTGTGR